jgi:ABC-type phosphate transport system substrate-binding protein
VCLLVVTFNGLAVGRVVADETPQSFVVIVNAESAESSATRQFVTDVFLKKTTHGPRGEQLRPVDLRPDSVTRSRFSDAVLRRSVSAVRNYWQQRIFTGRGVPPPEFESDTAVLRYVKLHPGAIGYVSAQADCREVKVLAIR